MIPRTISAVCRIAVVLIALPATALAQQPPYDVFPPADPPYYRVRYEASTQPGELVYPVNYTIWIPKDVKSLRGVIVHQHGCGEGSCKSGLTGAYDLHWQALAKKHDCALAGSRPTSNRRRPIARCGAIRATAPAPRFRSAWSISARSPAIRSCRRCRGRCGDTAAAVTGRAAWCCCIRNVSPPRGCARACRC